MQLLCKADFEMVEPLGWLIHDEVQVLLRCAEEKEGQSLFETDSVNLLSKHRVFHFKDWQNRRTLGKTRLLSADPTPRHAHTEAAATRAITTASRSSSAGPTVREAPSA